MTCQTRSLVGRVSLNRHIPVHVLPVFNVFFLAAERSLELKLEERLLTAVREGDTSELKKLVSLHFSRIYYVVIIVILIIINSGINIIMVIKIINVVTIILKLLT